MKIILHIFSIYLFHFQKFQNLWSKIVNDRFKQFDQLEFQNIDNWISNLI